MPRPNVTAPNQKVVLLAAGHEGFLAAFKNLFGESGDRLLVDRSHVFRRHFGVIALVAQARKYGLGMIFATQVPKNIDNKIISNCTTHFYGKMNAPTTIDAVQELMAAKGGGGSDIASLKAGEFYFTTEGMSAAEKIKTPLCLSHHPQNPLTQEEVVKRAKVSAKSPANPAVR